MSHKSLPTWRIFIWPMVVALLTAGAVCRLAGGRGYGTASPGSAWECRLLWACKVSTPRSRQ